MNTKLTKIAEPIRRNIFILSWVVIMCILLFDSVRMLKTYSIEYYAGKGAINELQDRLEHYNNQEKRMELLSKLLYIAVTNKKYETAKYLLDEGANPNYVAYAYDLNTPLNKAVLLSDSKMVALLLEYGADPHFSSIGIGPFENALLREDWSVISEFINIGIYPTPDDIEQMYTSDLQSRLRKIVEGKELLKNKED